MTDERAFTHRATYCPEDNKLRFYPDWSDGEFDKEQLKRAGYRWASKQECYVCPAWSPVAEDMALQYVDEIEDETYGPVERAADRAERFATYRENRREDAGAYADRTGGAVIGFQSETKAERAARRRERLRSHALTQWDRAEYWHTRTAGVIAHTIGKQSPAVRRSRIKGLESEQRKLQKGIEERAERRRLWARVAEMPGADVLLPLTPDGYGITSEANEAGKLAYRLANDGSHYTHLDHPRDEAANQYTLDLHRHRGFTPYDLLTKDAYGSYGPIERLTPGEVAGLYLAKFADPNDPATYSQRWARHYQNRLEFERAMLANEGGAADEAEIVPGGWLLFRGRWVQIQRVHKSPATGKPTSVEVLAMGDETATSGRKNARVSLERLGLDRYRAPSAEELAAFKAEQKHAKAEAKKTAPKIPPLINPTDEDAERLQAALNDRARAAWDRAKAKGRVFSDYKPSSVLRMSQTEYSRASKVSHSHLETLTVHDGAYLGRRKSNLWSAEGEKYTAAIGPARCKVRQTYGSGLDSAPRVIVLTDAKSKPLPIDWTADPFAVAAPTREGVTS